MDIGAVLVVEPCHDGPLLDSWIASVRSAMAWSSWPKRTWTLARYGSSRGRSCRGGSPRRSRPCAGIRAEAGQRIASMPSGLRVRRVETDGLVEVGKGSGKVTFVEIDVLALTKGLGVARLQADRLVEVGQALVAAVVASIRNEYGRLLGGSRPPRAWGPGAGPGCNRRSPTCPGRLSLSRRRTTRYPGSNTPGRLGSRATKLSG